MRSKIHCLLIFITFIAKTASGQVDPTFLPIVSDFAKIYQSVAQADGKIILTGEISIVNGEAVNKIVRLNVDGTVDKTFKYQVPEGVGIWALSIDANQKLICGGYKYVNNMSVSTLERLNVDGTVDPTFNVSENFFNIYTILSLSDGGYLVGHGKNGYLTKLRTDGSVDPSFNAGTGPNSIGISNFALAEMPDGKIVVAGTFDAFNGQPINRLVRLNANGSIDNTFNIGTGPDKDLEYQYLSGVAIDGDKIFVVGSFTSFNGVAVKNLVKLNNNGSVDMGFIYPGPSANYFSYMVNTIKRVSDGILLAGTYYDNSEFLYRILKLKLDGSLDNSFALNEGNLTNNASYVDAPMVTVAGPLVYYIGFFDRFASVPKRGIVRLFVNNGAVDPNFNANLGSTGLVNVLRVQPDGKIIIGGAFSQVGSTAANNIARLNADGSIDPAFASAIGKGFNRAVYCLEILGDGKILVGGAFDKVDGIYRTTIARLNSNGTTDNTFVSSISQNYIGLGMRTMKVLPSGKILAGGMFPVYGSGTTYYNLTRLNTNGTVDNTFTHPFVTDNFFVNSLGLQSDNSILITGTKYFTNDGGFLRKLDANGVVLNDFSTVNFGLHVGMTLKVLPDDKFLLGTRHAQWSQTDAAPLYQFSKEGAVLDKLSVSVTEGGIRQIEVLPNDYLLIGGDFMRVNGTNFRSFAKIKLNGTVESAFNYNVNGPVLDFLKVNPASAANSYFVMGMFSNFSSQKVYSVLKVDLDLQIAPTNLAYTLDDFEGTVALSWKDNSNAETGFSILRAEGAGSFVAIDSVPALATSYIDTKASAQKLYKYKVAAFTATAQSSFSNIVDVSTTGWLPPATPALLSFDVSSDFLKTNLSWTNVTSEKGYEIERSVKGDPFVKVGTTGKDIIAFSAPFDFESTVSYRVRSFNLFGNSEYTNVVALPFIMGVGDEGGSETRVYPNPAKDYITLEAPGTKAFSATIYDSEGKVVLVSSNLIRKADVDVTAFPRGFYVVKITQGIDVTVKKFLKI